MAKGDLRINDRIRVREVRVVDDAGEQLGVLPTDQAIEMARERGLDLVEVAPTATPPVCRILDYGKFKYEQAKRDTTGRKKQKRVLLREVKMKPNIGQHDMDFKTRTASKLLKSGDKVKLTVMFRGREITHPQIGRERIQQMMDAIEASGVPVAVEKPISMEGRFMSMIVMEDKVRAAALAKAQSAAEAEQGQSATQADMNDSQLTAEAEQSAATPAAEPTPATPETEPAPAAVEAQSTERAAG